MRRCTVLVTVCVLFTGCVTTTQDTSALRARVTKLENQVNGIESGGAGSTAALDQRLEAAVRDQNYLKANLEELSQSVARLEEQTGELRVEVGRLQDRTNQLETGSIAREKQLTGRMTEVSTLEERYGEQLADLRKDVDKALLVATEANNLSKSALAELTDRINKLSNQFTELFQDMKKELATPPVPKPAPAGSQRIHTVKAGETASAIAAKYGITLQKLRETNPHIPDLNVIRPGDELLIP